MCLSQTEYQHRSPRVIICLLLRVLKNLEADRAHDLAIGHCRFLVLLGNVIPASVGRVLLAVRRQAFRDADAGAVKFADDPLLLLRRRARGKPG